MSNNGNIDLFLYNFNTEQSHQKNKSSNNDNSIKKANVINYKLSQLYLKSYNEQCNKASIDIQKKLNLFTFQPIPSQRDIVFPDIASIEFLKKPESKPKPEPQLQIKEESKQINLSNPVSIVQPVNISPANRKYQAHLLSGAENFSKIKHKIKDLVFKEQYKEKINRITMTLNPIVFQINEKVDMDQAIKSLSKALNEIFTAKSKDLYIITIDLIVSLVINKAENYLKNTRDKYLYITKVITELHSSTLINLFFQRIAFNCPYIIPRQFTKKDYPNKEILLQRQGFIQEGEPICELNTRMENLEYLYFAFLYQNINKYIPVISEYLVVLSEIKVNFAIGNGYKVFLNVLGNALKPTMWNIIKQLSAKIDKDLKEEQSKTKISDIKAINDFNCLTISKYTEAIGRNMYTDMFDPNNL